MPDLKELSAKKTNPIVDASSKTCSVESDSTESYTDFRSSVPVIQQNHGKKHCANNIGETNQMMSQAPFVASYSGFCSPDTNELIKYGDWDELRSVVEFAFDPFHV